MSRKQKLTEESNDYRQAINAQTPTVSNNSCMLDANNAADNIHRENVKILEQMSEREILDERNKLMQSLGKFRKLQIYPHRDVIL